MRSKFRFKRLYRESKQELEKCQKEMASINEKCLETNILNLNISTNERTVIKEILEASKHDNSKARRYSEDWILLCLIFHMRSPEAYRLLRENKVLPLPCISTIRRYLSLMDTPCGFDDTFLQLFAQSLAKMPEKFRHCLLLLDEISTQKNVRLDPKTMRRLTDYGDEEPVEISEKADHGLVFMFHPIMESSTQPLLCVFPKDQQMEQCLRN